MKATIFNAVTFLIAISFYDFPFLLQISTGSLASPGITKRTGNPATAALQVVLQRMNLELPDSSS